MTVTELASRMSMYELEEWAALARVEKEERDNDARISRVEAAAKANRLRK